MPLAPGTLLNNRYRIVSILGQGGMGAVYRASDEHLSIPVAVKENLFLTDEYSRQFQREAHILAGLRHSNLPHVTDYFSLPNQGQYLVMDYIEGEDLRQRMERIGPLPERETTLIGISICDALSYLHNRRPPIVHRDIKPGNIKVTASGQAVLVDFGLAKIMQGSQATSTGARAMTPGYSPPEQYGTARTDPRSDIYSLGATLYATLTGVIPEDGLARMTGKTQLTPLRELAPRVNKRLAEAIELALEIDPEDRFQDAEEFKSALIESGELRPLFQERPTITPPPDEALAAEGAAAVYEAAPKPIRDEDEEILYISRPKDRNSRRRRKKRMNQLAYAGAFTVVLSLILVFLFANQGIGLANALAQLGFSTTATSPETAVAALDTRSATPEITMTLEPLAPQIVEEVTPSPTATESSAQITQTAEALTPQPTPLGGAPSQIAFASNRTGVMQIWLMNSDGTQQRQITNQPDGACQPSWSPDGMRLAFISPCPGRQDAYPGSAIYLMDLDSNNPPILLRASPEGDFDPSWSPDGRRIAFTSLRNNKPSIFVMDLETKAVIQLTDTRFADRYPSWAPSGMQLAFVRMYASGQVWTMSDSGQSQHHFSVSGNYNNHWPVWSQDGEVIYYTQTSNDSAVPWLMAMRFEDRQTSNEFRIPARGQKDPGPVSKVSISPDGLWFTYGSWPDGENYDIYIMGINGANQQRLTTDRAVDFGPAWRPMPPQQP